MTKPYSSSKSLGDCVKNVVEKTTEKVADTLHGVADVAHVVEEVANTSERVVRNFAKVFKKPSKTEQAHRNVCDINNIMLKYKQAGYTEQDFLSLGESIMKNPLFFKDCSVMPEGGYQDVMNAVAKANESFNSLPAFLRVRFNNNPQNFIDFVKDENNRDECIKLGFLKSDVVEKFVDKSVEKDKDVK